MNKNVNNHKLSSNFEQKLFSKIKQSQVSKSVFESAIIIFLSTMDIFFKLLKELFPPKIRRK